MIFSMTHIFFKNDVPIIFTESNAPSWLTSENTIVGSTMDYRWFWKDCVLTLQVGASIETDFRLITRIE